MKRVYMAHPLRGNFQENMEKAELWLRYLQMRYPRHDIVAPWLLRIQQLGITHDQDDDLREEGMRQNEEDILACDEIWLVGKQGSKGMWHEARFAIEHGVGVVNMTGRML